LLAIAHWFTRIVLITPEKLPIFHSYQEYPAKGVTEDGITENAITLFFGRTGRWHNQKML
jgi:hypothetical protein